MPIFKKLIKTVISINTAVKVTTIIFMMKIHVKLLVKRLSYKVWQFNIHKLKIVKKLNKLYFNYIIYILFKELE